MERGDFLIGLAATTSTGCSARATCRMTYSEQLGYPFDGGHDARAALRCQQGAGLPRRVGASRRTVESDRTSSTSRSVAPDTAPAPSSSGRSRCSAATVPSTCADYAGPWPGRGCPCCALVRGPAGAAGRVHHRPGGTLPRRGEPALPCGDPPGRAGEGCRRGRGGATFKWSRENGSVVFPVLYAEAAAKVRPSWSWPGWGATVAWALTTATGWSCRRPADTARRDRGTARGRADRPRCPDRGAARTGRRGHRSADPELHPW